MRVHEVAGLQHLPNYLLGLQVFDPAVVVSALQLIQNGPVELLEHQVNPVVLAEHLQQVHDVVVLELFEDSDLSEGRLPYLPPHAQTSVARLTYSSSSLSLNFLMATYMPVCLFHALNTMP